MTNLEVILDNGGGLTVQCDEFVHAYDDDSYDAMAKHAATDVQALLNGTDPSDWDGNEPENRIDYDQDEIRNGGYRVLNEGDLRGILAGGEADPRGHTETLFLSALIGRSIEAPTKTKFQIKASIQDNRKNVDGYNVHDYFQTSIDGIYPSRAMAEEVAASGYKGPDVDGVGCTWEIVEVDADNYLPV